MYVGMCNWEFNQIGTELHIVCMYMIHTKLVLASSCSWVWVWVCGCGCVGVGEGGGGGKGRKGL